MAAGNPCTGALSLLIIFSDERWSRILEKSTSHRSVNEEEQQMVGGRRASSPPPAETIAFVRWIDPGRWAAVDC
jgi:hypothetical protein